MDAAARRVREADLARLQALRARREAEAARALAARVARGELLNAALFTCNTGLTQCGWWVAHSWSLAVEEQFYLVWPLVVIALLARGVSRQRVRVGALLALVLAMLWSGSGSARLAADPGAVVRWGLPVAEVVHNGALVVVMGSLLFALGIVPRTPHAGRRGGTDRADGREDEPQHPLFTATMGLAEAAAVVWTCGLVLLLVGRRAAPLRANADAIAAADRVGDGTVGAAPPCRAGPVLARGQRHRRARRAGAAHHWSGGRRPGEGRRRRPRRPGCSPRRGCWRG